MPDKPKPLVVLTKEQITAIKQVQENMPELRREIAAMKKIGMDTTAIEEKIDWAEETGKALLETFT